MTSAVAAMATVAAAETSAMTSAMGVGATALLPELSDQAVPTALPLSRQITAAREWLANAEGVVIAASPLVRSASPAAKPPPITVPELGKSPAELMKGIGGSLMNMGSSLFGANKSPPPLPAAAEKLRTDSV